MFATSAPHISAKLALHCWPNTNTSHGCLSYAKGGGYILFFLRSITLHTEIIEWKSTSHYSVYLISFSWFNHNSCYYCVKIVGFTLCQSRILYLIVSWDHFEYFWKINKSWKKNFIKKLQFRMILSSTTTWFEFNGWILFY